MNLQFAWERYSYYSGKASDIVRQLGFAGIALIWIFKTEDRGQWRVPEGLMPAAIWIVAALILDFLQYTSGALIWGIFRRVKEWRKTPADAEFDAPRYINWPTLLLFWCKIVGLGVGYYFIFRHVAGRL